MEQNIIEAVLTEILEEQKIINEKMEMISGSLAILSSQTGEFKTRLTNIRLEVPPIDTFRIEGILHNHQQEVQIHIRRLIEFIEAKRRKKEFRDKINLWMAWLLVILLCAVIFRIAIGGNFTGSIF
jgi:hypothetical protein